ncbi:MAG TPA: cupin domain-containing protein [Gaiellaceae bacterium]
MGAFDHLGEIEPLRIWEGVVGRPVHGDELTLTLIELAPDSVVPEHAHVNEQVGVLLRGSVRFRIGDEEREIERGATWCIRAHQPHEVRTGPEGATLVEAFAPPRADWAALERLPAEPPRLS